jgi:hypothetical protein
MNEHDESATMMIIKTGSRQASGRLWKSVMIMNEIALACADTEA